MKLSKGKKKRSLLREKLSFKKQLDRSILNKNPEINETTKKQTQHPVSSKIHSLGSEERSKQHSSDISNMKAVMSNNTFKSNPLGSLKQHLLQKASKKMEVE